MEFETLTEKATLSELGQRIACHRLNKNMTQSALAIEAGVSKPTIQRVESGASTQTSNLIRILRALKLLGNVDALVPKPPISPVQQLKLQGKLRQRASSKKEKKRTDGSWSWGEET